MSTEGTSKKRHIVETNLDTLTQFHHEKRKLVMMKRTKNSIKQENGIK